MPGAGQELGWGLPPRLSPPWGWRGAAAGMGAGYGAGCGGAGYGAGSSGGGKALGSPHHQGTPLQPVGVPNIHVP